MTETTPMAVQARTSLGKKLLAKDVPIASVGSPLSPAGPPLSPAKSFIAFDLRSRSSNAAMLHNQGYDFPENYMGNEYGVNSNAGPKLPPHKSDTICTFFMDDSCKFGARCAFRHPGEFTFAHASSLSEPRKVRSQNPSSGLKIRSSVLHQSQVTAGGFPSSNSSVSRPIHGVNSYDPIILSGPGVPDVATNHQPAQYASIPTTVSTSSKPNLVPTLSEAKSKAKAFQDAKVKKNPMENTKTTLNVKRVSKEHSRGDSASSTDPDHSTELAGEIEVKESSSIAAVRRGDAASALMTLTSPLTTANLEVNSHSIKRSSDSLDEDGPPVKRQRQAERSVFDEMSAGMRESLKDEEISALQSELKKAHKKIQDNDDTISECKIKKMMMQKLLEANSGMDSVKIGVAMHYLENDCEPEIAIAKTLGKDRP